MKVFTIPLSLLEIENILSRSIRLPNDEIMMKISMNYSTKSFPIIRKLARFAVPQPPQDVTVNNH